MFFVCVFFFSFMHFRFQLNENINLIVCFRIALVGISFTALYFSRKSIDARRYRDYKIRQRMKEANEGDYAIPENYVRKSENN